MSFDLTTLDPEQITALVNAAPKRGFIAPGVKKFLDSGELIVDATALIDWPNNEDGTPKTVKQQVTALKQTIKNKTLENSWPELVAVSGVLNGATEPVALLVNNTLVKTRKAEAVEAANASVEGEDAANES